MKAGGLAASKIVAKKKRRGLPHFIFSSSSLHLLFIFSSSSKKWVENGVGKQYKFRIVGIGGIAAALKYLNIKI